MLLPPLHTPALSRRHLLRLCCTSHMLRFFHSPVLRRISLLCRTRAIPASLVYTRTRACRILRVRHRLYPHTTYITLSTLIMISSTTSAAHTWLWFIYLCTILVWFAVILLDPANATSAFARIAIPLPAAWFCRALSAARVRTRITWLPLPPGWVAGSHACVVLAKVSAHHSLHALRITPPFILACRLHYLLFTCTPRFYTACLLTSRAAPALQFCRTPATVWFSFSCSHPLTARLPPATLCTLHAHLALCALCCTSAIFAVRTLYSRHHCYNAASLSSPRRRATTCALLFHLTRTTSPRTSVHICLSHCAHNAHHWDNCILSLRFSRARRAIAAPTRRRA